MSKFNISVEIDWLDEDESLDERLKEEVISNIVSQVSGNLLASIEDEAKKVVQEQMNHLENTVSQRLNDMMEEFFSTPRDVTDRWGDVVEKGVTIKSRLKDACDKFMDQPVDGNGNPTKSSYDTKYRTRLDYIVAKSIDHNMEWSIKKAVEDVTNNLKTKIATEIKQQMGEKLANVVGLDSMLGK